MVDFDLCTYRSSNDTICPHCWLCSCMVVLLCVLIDLAMTLYAYIVDYVLAWFFFICVLIDLAMTLYMPTLLIMLLHGCFDLCTYRSSNDTICPHCWLLLHGCFDLCTYRSSNDTICPHCWFCSCMVVLICVIIDLAMTLYAHTVYYAVCVCIYTNIIVVVLYWSHNVVVNWNWLRFGLTWKTSSLSTLCS